MLYRNRRVLEAWENVLTERLEGFEDGALKHALLDDIEAAHPSGKRHLHLRARRQVFRDELLCRCATLFWRARSPLLAPLLRIEDEFEILVAERFLAECAECAERRIVLQHGID